MATTWVDSAGQAFEAALAELVGAGAPPSDPTSLGRNAALEAVAGSLWDDSVGPFYDSDGVRHLLGGVSKQAVSDRVHRHRLLALRTGSGRLVYPAFQFDRRSMVTGLAKVLAVVAPDDTEGWYVASWLTTPDPNIDNLTPVEALKAGRSAEVEAAASDVAASLRG